MLINWLRNKMLRILMTQNEQLIVCENDQPMRTGFLVSTRDVEPRLDFPHENILNVKIFGANGGAVVEFNRYNRKTDQQHAGVYVIPDTADFGSELSKIVTMEQLKNF